jgi:hypothetical protein
MPKWQFLIVKHFGGPLQRQQTCARIKQQVEQHGLSDILPLVKYERGRQREYYLGIAIDGNSVTEGRDAAEFARHVLVDAGVSVARNPQLSFVVEADEVQRLLTGTLEGLPGILSSVLSSRRMKCSDSSPAPWSATASPSRLFLTSPDAPMIRQQINSLRKLMRPICSGTNLTQTILRGILDCFSGVAQWDPENLRESSRHVKLWVFPVTGAVRGPFFAGWSCWGTLSLPETHCVGV